MIEINLFLLLTQTATFLAAMFIVWKMFWGPLTQFMQGRAKKIEEDIKHSETGRREVEALEAAYRQRLVEVEQHAQQEFKEALVRGQQAKDQILNEARQEAQRILEKAQADLILERDRVIQELREQVADLSMAAVERLLGQGLDSQVQKRLLDQFVKEVEATRSLS